MKKEIKVKQILNKKINQHNNQVKDFCLAGNKSLVSHWKQPMSLQKIQVELEVVRAMHEEGNEGHDLSQKVWNDF